MSDVRGPKDLPSSFRGAPSVAPSQSGHNRLRTAGATAAAGITCDTPKTHLPMDLSELLAPAKCVACHVYRDVEGRWHWEAVDAVAAVVMQSERGFETRCECVIDALRHGQATPLTPLVFC